MLEEGVLGAGLFFFLNKVEAMECIRPFCATTVSIPLTILRLQKFVFEGFFFFSFSHGGKKLYFKLASIVEEFSRKIFFKILRSS